MAKQESYIKLRGKVGDLSFYKSRNGGYGVRTKGGVDAERIAKDPNFQRTRENMSEFGRAVKTAMKFRRQLNNLLFYFGDSRIHNRLTSLIHRIQKADTVNGRGEREVLPENLHMLTGFRFNEDAQLQVMFGGRLPTIYDQDEGTVTLEIPGFDPQAAVRLLPDATHIRFVLAAAVFDPSMDVLPLPAVEYSDYIPLIGEFPGGPQQVEIETDPGQVIYVMVGISIYQSVNDGYYPLKNGLYNPLEVVQVLS